MHKFIFSNFALHITLTDAEQDHVAAQLQQATFKKGSIVLNSGEVCRNTYFINKGCLRIYTTDEKGEEHTVLFCPENWWASDIASFSTQAPAFYCMQALEDTEVFYFSYETLERLYIKVPKFERFFRILVQNGFYLNQRRITLNLSKTAQERYELFQKQYPGLEQRISQKHIAAYLGITPVFLSMIRKKNS